MPTGYTADITKGISFEQFALNCARAFGALVTMRDDPADAPIPSEFKPDGYAAKRLAQLQAELADINAMTAWQCKNAAISEYRQHRDYHIKGQKENAELREKYLHMLKQVEAWTPPTPEHEGLKKFMCEQITQSINFDCSDYHERALAELKPLSGSKWRAIKRSELSHQIQSQMEEKEKDEAMAASRTNWVQKLKTSLKDYKATL